MVHGVDGLLDGPSYFHFMLKNDSNSMVDLDFYSQIKMDEKSIIDFISLKGNGIGGQVFEFSGTNGRKVSMMRGGDLHRWLVEALNDLAFVAKTTKKVVYLIDVESMVQEECRKFYDRKKRTK